MSYFASRSDRKARRGCSRSGWRLESLERRELLSAAASDSVAPIAIVAGMSSSRTGTVTALAVSSTTAQSGQALNFGATVQTLSQGVPVGNGQIKFVVNSPTHQLLGTVPLNKAGQADLTTSLLTQTTTYHIAAVYVPPGTRFAASASAPVDVTVSPLSPTSFRVVPASRRGYLGRPVTFTVTAMSSPGKVDPNYTGTIVFSSPTDSSTTLPSQVYVSLNISAPAPQTAGLAIFPHNVYTFTTSDHGSHTFVGGVTFQKGGAERLKVSQIDNNKLHGITTVGIG